ncbi:MAG: hypothetical protein EP326_06240 [Deltaproteobacteria bacterium]|jgi:hypothetical protein|nr:MAG: hypothetical protein EP326_06240 [Deltaproteobacteria bacterium]TNF27863.1 MAG: hypothetical protein EP319_10245 [Deltaproteobacteria bacterium]
MRIILLFLLSFSTAYAENSLTLHIIRSPNGLDWSHPRSLARTVVMNALSPKNRMIGHVAVELKCEAVDGGAEIHELTGTSNAKSSVYSNQILFKKMGFGVIFDTYDGVLESKNELLEEFEKKYNKKRRNRITFIKHLINSQTCLRLKAYLDEYRKMGYGNFYGLPLRPLQREGAGCSAFGVSFLSNAGLMREEFSENWTYDLRVPSDLIGGEFHPDGSNKVNLFKLYFLKNSKNRWASADEDHKRIFFWDPDTMYRWTLERVRNMDYPRALIVKRGESHGLVIQAEHIPTPDGPLFEN